MASTTMASLRQLTRMAGERIAELLHWRTMGDLEFAVVIWRRGEDRAETYVSRTDEHVAQVIAAALHESEQ